jgi:hypothetical protein
MIKVDIIIDATGMRINYYRRGLIDGRGTA